MQMSPVRILVLVLLGIAALVTLTIFFYMVFLSPGTQNQPVDEGAIIYTQAAQTLQVQLTQIAANATGTAAAIPPTVTFTPSPQLPTNTPRATNTPLPIATNTPLFTPTPFTVTPASHTSVPGGGGQVTQPVITPGTPGTPGAFCNAAKFIEDVTIPDGTKINPGSGFTKTWRLENFGACTWTTDYKLVFVKGDQMSAPQEIPIPTVVKPGDKIDLSVNMIAPINPGEYESYWKLQDSSGQLFGTGTFAENSIWAIIEVKEIKSGLVFDFVSSACSAKWVSSSGTLTCPGKEGDAKGYVIPMTSAPLENRNENEPTLLTRPDEKDNGYITGTYPPFAVKDGDEFITDIGCLADSEKCNVEFRLDYRLPNGKVNNLGVWDEKFDGYLTSVRLDLSDIADKTVEFILTVSTNGSPSADNAIWFVPQVQRD
jgi:Ig-like domain from next to BRCA1 gene